MSFTIITFWQEVLWPHTESPSNLYSELSLNVWSVSVQKEASWSAPVPWMSGPDQSCPKMFEIWTGKLQIQSIDRRSAHPCSCTGIIPNEFIGFDFDKFKNFEFFQIIFSNIRAASKANSFSNWLLRWTRNTARVWCAPFTPFRENYCIWSLKISNNFSIKKNFPWSDIL